MVVLAMGGGSGCLKAEKAMAIRRYRRLRQLATVLRCLEVAAALFALSWSSAQLPTALQLLSAFLRRLSSVLISTPFVFLLGNAIVVTLFAKSRHLSSCSSSDPDLYNDFLRSSSSSSSSAIDSSTGDHRPHRHHQQKGTPSPPAPSDVGARPVACVDKDVCVVDATFGPERPALSYRRTKSELLEWVPPVKGPELRRSVTDVASALNPPPKKADDLDDGEEEEQEDNDVGMSDDELRRRVEAFIAKTLRFQREESIAMVIAGGGTGLLE